jgi:ABC-type uncharacterized transport system substrate-binding protein
MNNRVQSLLFTGVICLLLVAQCQAADYIVFASTSDDIFKDVVQGVTDVLGSDVDIAYTGSDGKSSVQDQLRNVRNGKYKGVVIAGKAALAATKSGLSGSIPVALCAYSEFSENEMTVKRGTPNQIFTVMTPITDYPGLISEVFPSSSKIAVIHKTDFNFPSVPGLQTKVYRINSWKQLKSTVTNAVQWGDILWLPADPSFTSTALAFVIKACLKSKTPLLTSSPRIIKGGAVSGIVRSPSEIGTAIADWVKDSGATGTAAPSTIDKIRPDLVINPKVAKFLGISLPARFGGKPTISITDYK